MPIFQKFSMIVLFFRNSDMHCLDLSPGISAFHGRFSRGLPNGPGKVIYEHDLSSLDGPVKDGVVHGKSKLQRKQGKLQFIR